MENHRADAHGESAPRNRERAKTHPITWCVLVLFILFVLFPFWMPVLAKLHFDERVQSSSSWKLEVDEVQLAEIDALIEEHSREIGPVKAGDGTTFQDFVGSVEHECDVDGDDVEDSIRLDSGHDLSIFSSKRGKEWSAGISDFPSGGTSVGFDDIDADGALDAWCCDPGDGLMRVFYGDGKGRFRKKQRILGVWGGAKGAFFDVDEDGDLDIVMKVDHEAFQYEPDRPTDYLWIQLGQVKEKRNP